MSVKIMGQVWDLQLTAPKLLVMLALSDHADHNGNNVFPSVELVAWKTCYSESQTRRIMKQLENDGLLEAKRRPGKTTLYSIHLERGKLKAKFERSAKGMQNDTPVIAMTPQPSHSYDTPTPVIAMTPESSTEPSNNHHLSPDGETASKKARKPNPNEPIRNALLQCFGLTPETVTKSGDRTYWVATADFAKINFPLERIPEFHKWCVGQGWKSFSVMAMAKNAGEWLVKNGSSIGDDDPYAKLFESME